MKQINYYLGALAVASLGLWSCSSDDLRGEEPNGPGTDVERTVYVNVAIHGENPGSRAAGDNGNPDENTSGDFEDGTNESTVNSCYLVFYDAAGNTVGGVVNVTDPGFAEVAAPNGTVQTQAKKVVAVTLQQGDQNPAQVMCYINPANPADLQNPLSTVQTVTRDAVTINGTGNNILFPMSNSVYYPAADGATGFAENPVMAVQIPDECIFDTQKAAQDELDNATSKKVIDIYVERYAAKLQMNVGADAVKDYATFTTGDGALGTAAGAADVPVVLSFKIDGWDLNGEAKTTYAVKSFRQATEAGQIANDNYTFSVLNGRINAETFSYENGVVTAAGEMTGPWIWNNPDYHRSYWACSPVYFQSEYPEVLSDYDKDNSNQIFKSWTQIVEGGKNMGQYYYFKETTSGIPALKSKNPNAAIPTIALVGHYEMTVNGTPVTGNPTFYTYLRAGDNDTPVVYFANATDNEGSATAASAVAGGLSMHKRFLWQTTVLYHNIATAGEVASFERMSAGNEAELKAMVRATTITRPSDKVLGDVKMTSVARTLQLTGDDLTGIYINDNGKPKAIVADDVEIADEDKDKQIHLTDANRILWRNVGTCNLYTEAAGKFTIPVKHLGWYRTGNPQRDAETIDMSKAHVGDFGLVRNHAYSISVSKIEGLAAGIGGKSDEIIPPADTRDVYTAYRINILRWAVVPTQNVEL